MSTTRLPIAVHWNRVQFGRRGDLVPKLHLVPEHLEGAVIAEMTERGNPFESKERVPEGSRVVYDPQPGMWFQNQPFDRVLLGDVLLEYPSIDAEELRRALDATKPRAVRVEGVLQIFFKLHTRVACLVLDGVLRNHLLAVVASTAAASVARGREFVQNKADRHLF